MSLKHILESDDIIVDNFSDCLTSSGLYQVCKFDTRTDAASTQERQNSAVNKTSLAAYSKIDPHAKLVQLPNCRRQIAFSLQPTSTKLISNKPEEKIVPPSVKLERIEDDDVVWLSSTNLKKTPFVVSKAAAASKFTSSSSSDTQRKPFTGVIRKVAVDCKSARSDQPVRFATKLVAEEMNKILSSKAALAKQERSPSGSSSASATSQRSAMSASRAGTSIMNKRLPSHRHRQDGKEYEEFGPRVGHIYPKVHALAVEIATWYDQYKRKYGSRPTREATIKKFGIKTIRGSKQIFKRLDYMTKQMREKRIARLESMCAALERKQPQVTAANSGTSPLRQQQVQLPQDGRLSHVAKSAGSLFVKVESQVPQSASSSKVAQVVHKIFSKNM